MNLQPGLIALDLWEGFPLHKCSVCGLIMFHCGEWERWYAITSTFSKDWGEGSADTSYAPGGRLIKTAGRWCERGRVHSRAGQKGAWKTREWGNHNQIRWPLISLLMRCDCVWDVSTAERSSSGGRVWKSIKEARRWNLVLADKICEKLKEANLSYMSASLVWAFFWFYRFNRWTG